MHSWGYNHSAFGLNKEEATILFEVIQDARDALKAGIDFKTGDTFEAALAAKNDLEADSAAGGLFDDLITGLEVFEIEVAGVFVDATDISA